MMAAATLPETVTVPTEALIENLAILIGVEDFIVAFTGDTTPLTDRIAESAAMLLHAITAPDDPYPYADGRHPLTVETYARARERTAKMIRERQQSIDADRLVAAAAAIRETGYAFPD